MTLAIDISHLKSVEELVKSQRIVSKYDPVEFLPTGSLALDYCLGGGWARGRHQCVSGQPGYGKSSICLMSGIQTVRDNRLFCVIDTENAWDLSYANRSGLGKPYIIRENKIIEHGDYFYFNASDESVGNIIRLMAKIGCTLCVIDGASTIYSTAQIESDDFTSDPMMGRAKLLGRIVNLTSKDLLLSGMAVLWTNQYREQKDYTPTRPGGKIFQHAHSIAVDLYSPEMFFTEKSRNGSKANLKPEAMTIVGRTYKNKVAPNFREFELNIKTAPRLIVNRAMEIVEIGREVGVIVDKEGKQGAHNSTFFFGGEQIAVGNKACAQALMEKPELAEAIETQIRMQIEIKRQTET